MAIANTSPGTPPRLPFRNLPYPRNKCFAHREEILSEVHSTLQSGRQRVATGNIQECPAVALVGLGGIGKTQVALEYCYRHQDEYEVIIWLRAETPTQLVRDTQQVAQSWGLLDDNRSAGSPEDAWPKLIQRASKLTLATASGCVLLISETPLGLSSMTTPMVSTIYSRSGPAKLVFSSHLDSSTGCPASKLLWW
jgi:hypothetical protein